MTTKLQIHPDRSGKFVTGVITRAIDPETGKVRSADISELTGESLTEWLTASRKVNDHHAEEVIQTLLGHNMPEGQPEAAGVARAEEACPDAAARVRQKLVALANGGDALVAELGSEAMKYILDLLSVVDEPYDPEAATMVGLLITQNAGRTKTGRAMWSKYLTEDAPQSVAKFREQMSASAGKDS